MHLPNGCSESVLQRNSIGGDTKALGLSDADNFESTLMVISGEKLCRSIVHIPANNSARQLSSAVRAELFHEHLMEGMRSLSQPPGIYTFINHNIAGPMGEHKYTSCVHAVIREPILPNLDICCEMGMRAVNDSGNIIRSRLTF